MRDSVSRRTEPLPLFFWAEIRCRLFQRKHSKHWEYSREIPELHMFVHIRRQWRRCMARTQEKMWPFSGFGSTSSRRVRERAPPEKFWDLTLWNVISCVLETENRLGIRTSLTLKMFFSCFVAPLLIYQLQHNHRLHQSTCMYSILQGAMFVNARSKYASHFWSKLSNFRSKGNGSSRWEDVYKFHFQRMKSNKSCADNLIC